MPRYIKTDIIAKIVFDKWKECEKIERIIPEIRRAIMYESTDDVVEVVRCKDCVYIDVLDTEQYYARCNWHGRLFLTYGSADDTRNWFCASGERREE